jgi:hypothetical protein
MKKKDALLKSLIELKSAHEKASKVIAEITVDAAKAAKGGDTLPSVSQLRQYKEAIAIAKFYASRAEMILVEEMLPPIPPETLPRSSYLQ